MRLFGFGKKKVIKEEVKELSPEELKKKEKREKRIRKVMDGSGWDRETAVKNMKDAKARIGISNTDYVKNSFYLIPVEEQEERYKKILEKREKDALYVKAVAETTGWSETETSKKMKAAKKKLGCSYFTYFRFGFYELTPEEQAEKLLEVKETRKDKKKDWAESARISVEKVASALGIDSEKAKELMQEARERTGANFNEYAEFKMYEMDEKLQNELFLRNQSKKITKRYNTDKNFNVLLCDKKATNEYLSEYVRRPWVTNTDVTFEQFCETFKGVKKVFYKPLSLNGGRGAVPFDLTEDNMREVYDAVKTYDRGVIEKYVIQHPKENQLSPTAVNTIRFVTVSSDIQPVTADGKQMDFCYAVQKMGGPDSVVDNLHAGGIASVVDLETGIIATDGIDRDGNIVEFHPVTGTKIKGFEIPMYLEAKKMVEDAIQKYNLVGYLGWDVAIEEDGPSLIELNVTPGVNLITHTLSVTEKRGVREHMNQYLF